MEVLLLYSGEMMKSWYSLLLALLITSEILAASDAVFTDPFKTIIVRKSNPTFTIIVESNPTTGYSWVLKSYSANLIVPISRKFYRPQSKKLLVGSPGYEKWTFRIKPEGFTVPQLTSITLIYLRPWDELGAQITNFKVVTQNAN